MKTTSRITIILLLLCIGTPDMVFSQELSPLTRLKYNNPGLVVDLGVGLWAWPMPMDHDGDGDIDLLVACPDRPSNGVWYFENPGVNSKARLPVFKAGMRLGPASADMTLSMVNGTARILAGNNELIGFRDGDWKTLTSVYPSKTVLPIQHNRDNFWRFADYDGDGLHDLLVGHGDWTEFGWFTENDWWKDYNWQGVWTGGPLRSHVLWLRNHGTDAAPEYASPEPILANGVPISTYGRPGQNLADFDGDGDQDLLCGSFLDSFTYYQNTGTRTSPVFAEGRPLVNEDRVISMDLEMIVPHAIDWDHDGDVDLIVGDEDGRVALVEHKGHVIDGLPQFERPYYFQQVADELKSGALASPSAVDWDGDADDDIITGNTAGYIELFENLSGRGIDPPAWAAPVRLTTNDNVTIRIMAGPNGSIQGPCEAKWGYTTVSAIDWDHDGLPDILANSIRGRVDWYRNIGSREQPQLATAAPIKVEWPLASHPPKPAWNWWNPEPGELVTQWRTTPAVADLNGDGLNDLVMLDHEGWLCFWPRERSGGQLILKPGERVLCDEKGEPLRLNPGSGGRSGRRKLHVADWDGDGKLDLLLNGTNAEFWRQVACDAGVWKFQRISDVSSTKIDAHDTSPTTVDFDADGHRDLVIGAEDGRFYFLRGSVSETQATAKSNGVACAPNDEPATKSAGPASSDSLPEFPGKRTKWNGFDRFDFEVDGRPVLVVAPKEPAPGRPWVWHGEFFGHKPDPDIALLKRGFHIVYMSVPDMLGSPKAVAHWDQFYDELTTKYGFAKKAALVGLSRGGLYCYNWAAVNPDRVACIYADAPVCDFKSWPGGKGKGKGSPRDWNLVLQQYGFANEQEALDYKGNPIDSLAPLARAGVPLLHVYGDADDVVPWEENTGIVADRYKALGGTITLIAKPGVGHHPHGLEDSTPIVEFIFTHCLTRNAANLDQKTILRVLSYNIHHAEGIDGKLDVARIARVINDCQPDLVALQEVDKLVKRTETIDQPSELARLTNMHVVFGGNIELQGGHYGNAILSRFQVTYSENHLLPCLNDGEQRGVLEATIQLPNNTSLRLLATHFDHRSDDAERQQSATAVQALMHDSEQLPAIFAGDLNDTISSPTLNSLLEHWSRPSKEVQPTIPVAIPDRQIDFVLFRPTVRWKVVETRVFEETIASDHRPILAVLELLPEVPENP